MTPRPHDALLAHATADFDLVGDNSSAPPDRYAVVLRQDVPVGLRAPGGPAAPAVLLDAGSPFEILRSPAVISLLDLEVPGLVLLRDDRVAGVLPATVVLEFVFGSRQLLGGERGGPHGDGAEHQLSGAELTPRAVVVCACGFVNTVDFYDRGRTRCQAPDGDHLLTRDPS